MFYNRIPKDIGEKVFDVLVIGGGITGAGIARDAAMRGMSVCLLEKSDFASGTSSKSSKLIHGGVRYLEQGNFKLVFEASQERRILMEIAPHLVKPLRFLIPTYKGDSRSPLKIRMGMLLYDLLSAFHNVRSHEKISSARIKEMEPDLTDESLLEGVLYYDCQMNDARLCLENILSAEEYGAVCLNYARATGFSKIGANPWTCFVRDEMLGASFKVFAHVLVNAGGPWAEEILKIQDPKTPRKLHLSKGIHVIVPKATQRDALLLTTRKDNRVFFVIPWGNFTLLGTTETDYSGSLEDVRAEKEDVEYLIAETQRLLPELALSESAVISTYAGVRPLVYQEGKDAHSTSREHVVEQKGKLISVFGGKYTTYRNLSKQVVDMIAQKLAPQKHSPCETHKVPVFGGRDCPSAEELAGAFNVSREKAENITSWYGSKCVDVLTLSRNDPSLTQNMCASHSHLMGEILYAFMKEKALTVSDFLSRRTFIRYSSCRGLDCVDTVVSLLEKYMGVDRVILEEQKKQYLNEVQRDIAFRQEIKT